MSDDGASCPSTYSPGRAMVMTTSFASAVSGLRQQVEALPSEPPWRTVEALLVQLEQIFERMRTAGLDVSPLEESTEIARHALSGDDVSLAVDSLRQTVSRVADPLDGASASPK